MTFFRWDKSLETGNAVIDGQHRQLIMFANLLHEAITLGRGEDVILEAFRALNKYCSDHFRDEEDFLVRIKSPMLACQRREHAVLSRELCALWAEKMIGFVDGIPDTLEKWVSSRLLPHMKEADCRAIANVG